MTLRKSPAGVAKLTLVSILSGALLVMVLMVIGCSSSPDGTMKTTTSSEKALAEFEQGRELWEKLRAQEALPYFENAVAEDPDFALAYLHLSFASQSAKDFFANLDKAVELADKASAGERLWILGSEAGANGEPMKQREYFRQLVDSCPNDKRAHNVLGNHYFGQQEWELAIEQYNQAIAIDSTFSQPYNQLGYAHRFLENYDAAEAAFKKYVELIPNDPNPYDSYAELLMKMGRYQESISEYQRALDVKADFPASHFGIASNYVYLEKHDDARQQLRTMYDLAHNDGQRRAALGTMAMVEIDAGKYAEAMTFLDSQVILAAAINDHAAMSGDFYNMGNTMYEAGKYDEAQALYEKGLAEIEATDLSNEIKENTRRFQLWCEARLAMKRGKLDDATRMADTYMQKAQSARNNFQIWIAHQLKGEIAMAQKKYDVAVQELQQANLQNPYVLYLLAQSYKSAGNMAKAREFYDKAANFNQPIGFNYAYIRQKADRMLAAI